MKYFTIAELSRSATAEQLSIDNTPPAEAKTALIALVDHVLDPIRQAWGKPITISSGYRSAALNSAIDGARRSQHMRGQAADITAGSVAANEKLLATIIALGAARQIEFDQLINENDCAWIHISFRNDGKNRHQIMKLR